MENEKIAWNDDTKIKFDQMLEKIPVFLRPMAQDKVTKKAENLVKEDDRTQVEEKDLVDALFAATPFGFHGPMKTDMEELGIDYVKYGHLR